MKKILLTLLLVAAGAIAISAAKTTVSRNELPQKAQAFLDRHFPRTKVGLVKIDKHFLGHTEYDVKLVNGTEVDFDYQGEWKSVECKRGEVPHGIVPQAISNYVKRNFSDVSIVSIEKKSRGYEVDLSDDVDLYFDAAGNFLRADFD